MSLNLSNDWQVIDDLQTVTYSAKVSEGTYTNPPATVPSCYWEELTELDYRIRPDLLAQQARAVHLWSAKLGPNLVPKLSDKVTDGAGLAWYVTRVEYLDLDATGVQRYRLTLTLGN